MANKNQTGYFKISHEDLDGTETIVPKDEVGDAPSGKANDSQTDYDLAADGEETRYYVHVINALDQDVNWNVLQSHMFDEEFENPVDIFDTDKTVSAEAGASPGDDPGTAAYSGDEHGSKFGVSLTPAADPTSGYIIVIIQKASV